MQDNFTIAGKKIWIPGSGGMIGSALVRRLLQEDVTALPTTRQDIDLSNYSEVDKFYNAQKPDVVLLAAAKVGGIYAHKSNPTQFLYENLSIQNNVIHLAAQHNVQKLLFLSSSWIYPAECTQPIHESSILTGYLENTSQWSSIAKIAGMKMCQAYRKQYNCNFISVVPGNVYGPNDDFTPRNSRVAAALLARFHQAKTNNEDTVTVGGTGKPMREFLHVDDLADACIFIMQNYCDDEHINIGAGSDISIAEFAHLIASITGYNGEIAFDHSRPDGTYRKLLDVGKLHQLGWRHKIKLEQGLRQYYQWYLEELC